MFGNRVGKYPQKSGLAGTGSAADKQRFTTANLVGQEVCDRLRQCAPSNQIINCVMAARKFPYRDCW